MRHCLILAACALPLAACDGDAPTTQPDRPIVVRSPEQDQLHKLSELNRAIALKRALYASGYRCQRVESSGFVGAYRNLDMWTAACDDGRNWAIFTGPDGTAQVRDCRDVEKVGLPACTVRATPAKTG